METDIRWQLETVRSHTSTHCVTQNLKTIYQMAGKTDDNYNEMASIINKLENITRSQTERRDDDRTVPIKEVNAVIPTSTYTREQLRKCNKADRYLQPSTSNQGIIPPRGRPRKVRWMDEHIAPTDSKACSTTIRGQKSRRGRPRKTEKTVTARTQTAKRGRPLKSIKSTITVRPQTARRGRYREVIARTQTAKRGQPATQRRQYDGRNPPQPTLFFPYECVKCHFVTDNLAVLVRHNSEHLGVYRCRSPHCKFSSRDEYKTKQHTKIYHTWPNPDKSWQNVYTCECQLDCCKIIKTQY